jgi:hypothetical protein
MWATWTNDPFVGAEIRDLSIPPLAILFFFGAPESALAFAARMS